ncbi:MAG: branched-chain amino acid ABC transporter permease, partial [Streptosporangiaceae bacterium]
MTWVNTVLQGILLGGYYALFAAGLSLMFGVMRLVNLAHGDLAVLAAFGSVVLVDQLHMNAWETLIVVVPLMALLGYALQRWLLNFTVGATPLPSILVTFGLSVIIANTLLQVFSADTRGLQAGAISTASIQLGDGLAVGSFDVVVFAVAIAVLAGLQLMLTRTTTGRLMRACSDDRQTASLMGINERHVYALATAIALGTVAVAGIFEGMSTQFTATSGPMYLIFAFEAVVIGGLGSIWGTLAGGIVLGVAQTIGGQI